MRSEATGALSLPTFRHLVGRHCSSSAVQSVLAYDGVELSEALVFGLGSGLGFFYAVEPEGSPTRRFNGRAPDLEGNFYRLLGRPLEWLGRWDPEAIYAGLAAGRPILAQTDIFPLPYYDDAHFIGHGLVVVGAEQETLQVADIASADLLELPISAFCAAVSRAHPPLLAPFRYAVTPSVAGLEVKLDELAPRALAKTARYLLEPPTPGEGVAGMRAMAAALPDWAALPDAAWCARFGYQAIEKRGSGGGNFRFLFRDFLAETQPHTKVPDALIHEADDLGHGWRSLANLLKEAAFDKAARAERFAEAGRRLAALADAEERLFSRLAPLLPSEATPPA